MEPTQELKAYTASNVFDGKQWLGAAVVLVSGDGDQPVIRQVIPASAAAAFVDDHPDLVIGSFNGLLVPAFTDLQLYGAGGRLLSAYPEPSSLERMAAIGREGGTIRSVPTVATNSEQVMKDCIDAVRAYWQQGGRGIHGLHLEGPWINPVRKGAHIEEFIRVPAMQDVRELLDYGEGVIRVITLAPERCPPEIIHYIQSRGILVSAGHSDATYRQAIDAFDAGIPTVTHLFNAMSPLHHRSPGLAGAAMDHPEVFASIIPDGLHVDFAAVRIAKKAMGERLFAITDSVTETGIGPYPHVRKGNKFEAEGILSGSALQMNLAVSNLVNHCGIEAGEAIRMCSLYPCRLLGLERHGRIAKDHVAEMLVLDADFAVQEVIG